MKQFTIAPEVYNREAETFHGTLGLSDADAERIGNATMDAVNSKQKDGVASTSDIFDSALEISNTPEEFLFAVSIAWYNKGAQEANPFAAMMAQAQACRTKGGTE